MEVENWREHDNGFNKNKITITYQAMEKLEISSLLIF